MRKLFLPTVSNDSIFAFLGDYRSVLISVLLLIVAIAVIIILVKKG